MPIFVITMQNAMVSDIKTQAGGEGQFPTDIFKLNFQKIQIEYKQQGVDVVSPGNFGWDLSLNLPA